MTDDDAPLLSPRRLWYALRLWAYLGYAGAPVSLVGMLRYYRRPFAAHTARYY